MADRDPFDPLAGLRAMADAQRHGIEAATAVVERMLELSRQSVRAPFPFHLPAEPIDGSNGDGAEAPRDREREVRRLRADAERLLELLGESLRVLFDVAADAAEAGIDGPDGGADRLLLGPVPAGAVAVGRAWLHILDGPPGAPARLSMTTLTAHAGATIDAAAASFEPPLLDTYDLRSSKEVTVAVAVPEASAPGVYYGHILAAGLPEVGLALRVEVSG